MIISEIVVGGCSPQTIVIGRRGTYDTLQVVFDLTYLIDTYGDGSAILMVKRNLDETAYPAETEQEDGKLLWTVSNIDTAYKGLGECEIFWYVDENLAKSVIFPLTILRDIGETTEEPPEPYETWVDSLLGLGAITQENARKAAQSESEAKVSEDNAAESAQRAEEAAELLTNVSATATTLEPGQEATAEYDDGVFKFGIPKGPKGDKLTYADLTDADKADLVQGPILEAQTSAVQAVNTAGETQTERVNTAGTTQTAAVNQAGTTQVGNVNDAGTAQVAAVEAEGTEQVGAVRAKGAEVLESIPDDYTELQHHVDVVTIYDTASGSIASFEDGADDLPIKKLVANIEPVQDLHGYDHPWPAGGGTNKTRYPYVLSGTRTINGITFTINSDGTITANGTATALAQIDLYGTLQTDLLQLENGKTYTVSGTDVDGTAINYYVYKNGSPFTEVIGRHNSPAIYSVPDDGNTYACRLLTRVISGTTVTNAVFKPMLAEGSTALPFAPYSNICPISGHTGAEIKQTGKNLFAYDGVYESETSGTIVARQPMKIPKGTYCFTVFGSIGNAMQLTFTNENSVRVGTVIIAANEFVNGKASKAITVTGESAIVNLYSSGSYNITALQLELGSTATAYEPYQGNQISVDWEDEAGTVYGGTLDLVSGKLTVDRAAVDMGTLSWDRNAATGGKYRMQTRGLASVIKPPSANNTPANIICLMYKTIAANDVYGRTIGIGVYSSGDVAVYDEDYSDGTRETISAFNAAMSGVQLCYELAAPIEYQLTPQEIRTLLGTNNVWADTGDVTVEYPADTKLYIEQLTKPTEDDMVANANISANKFFMIGNALYYSTAAIAAGATIIPGTNCNAVSLADALNTLNA